MSGETMTLLPEADSETLVERLMELARSFAVYEDDLVVEYSDGAILVEAADEIIRLRARLARVVGGA